MDNVKEFPNVDDITDEAAAWVVKIQGHGYKTGQEMPEQQVAELRAWLGQSQRHRDSFLKMLASWDAMGVLEELAEIFPLNDTRKKSALFPLEDWFPAFGFRLGSGRAVHAFLGSVVALSAIALGAMFFSAPQYLEYATSVGQQAQYVLSDGSRIKLNTDTLLRVDFKADNRVVTIEHGEVHFDVAKDADRPFLVYAGDGMVWAVGTSFNVNYSRDYVDVIVSEGTVKVFSGVTFKNEEPVLKIDASSKSPGPGEKQSDQAEQADYFREVVLEQGETAQYSQNRVSKESIDEQLLANGLAWQSGILVFQGETLEQALTEISRYTERRLLIVDPSISDASVGGRFKTSDIDMLVNSLALGLGIKIEVGEGDSILFSAY